MSTQKFVLLKSKDSEDLVKVRLEAASLSGNIKNMIDDLGTDNLDHAIPLSDIEYGTLLKVVEYCEHYADKSVEATDEKSQQIRNNEINDWDKKFLSVEQKELFAITMAANFLDIKSLLDVCCKSIANMIKGKSVDEIRETFGIVNDFTEEEERKIKEEHSWVGEQAV